MIAAFQGVPGAYSQLACRQLLGEGVKTLACETFDEVFAAVEKGRADLGVIPIENSLAGSIHQNYDLLLAHDLAILGETRLRVEHVLMCHPGTSWARLTEVRSHPQALAQCSAFFAREKGKVRPVSYFDTAGAAKSLADEAPASVGAIASGLAAELYGLKVLKRNLQNHADNFTRFLAIAPRTAKGRALAGRLKRSAGSAPAGRTPGLKTSIAYMPAANQVGVLFRALGVFALRDIDLLKIESRPNPLSPFEYWFYLDFAGGEGEPRVDKALDHLREMGGTLKILGSYPRASAPARKAAKAAPAGNARAARPNPPPARRR